MPDPRIPDLGARLQAAQKAFRAQEIILFIQQIINLRVQRNEWLPGSSPNAGRYSRAWEREREKKGYTTARVTLQFDSSVQLLESMHGKTETLRDAIQIHFGYLDGISEQEATKIARYHNVSGAGRKHVIRKYVGLTDIEVQRIKTAAEAEWINAANRAGF